MAKTLDVSKSVTPTEAPTFSTDVKDEAKRRLAKCIEEDTKMVKGRFRNLESPGSLFKCPPMRKYSGVEFKGQWMSDGEIYTIPRWVANHLNGFDCTASKVDGQVHSCQYPTHGFKANSSDFPTKRMDDDKYEVSKWTSRYRFESLEFEKVV